MNGKATGESSVQEGPFISVPKMPVDIGSFSGALAAMRTQTIESKMVSVA